jgi:molybdate transport system ATP-binding protein
MIGQGTTGRGMIRARLRGSVGKFALDAIFETPAKGLTALFGPSGCGKTTVLRCAAGLQKMADGYFAVGDEVWQDGAHFLPPYQRPIGFVFQEASLFAHMSVRRNLLYGQRRAVPDGVGVRFDDVVGLLGIEALLDRSPLRLSGGERQRVAVGRALLSRPKLLLMDEPLSALDRFAKDEILPYLERLHATLAIPVLYVSHDIAEVERLADHIILLEKGQVVRAGRLRDIQSDPTSPLARLPDAAVGLVGTIEGQDSKYGLTRIAVNGGALLVPAIDAALGESRRIRVVASDVSLVLEGSISSTILNSLPGRILSAEPQGPYQFNVVIGLGQDGGGDRILSHITRKSWETLKLSIGSSVSAQIKSIALA